MTGDDEEKAGGKIRNMRLEVPEDVHRALKVVSALNGEPIISYTLRILRDGATKAMEEAGLPM